MKNNTEDWDTSSLINWFEILGDIEYEKETLWQELKRRMKYKYYGDRLGFIFLTAYFSLLGIVFIFACIGLFIKIWV